MEPDSRLLQTLLLDGTLEGVKAIEIYMHNIRAYVVPRLRLSDVKNHAQLQQPALYFLLSADNTMAYIGETENFYKRVKTHDQTKAYWDIAVAFIAKDDSLEKGDVKYLESLAVERAKQSSVTIKNDTSPARNNIHAFKRTTLEGMLTDDVLTILTFLGYNVFVLPVVTEQIWYCTTNRTQARATFRSNKFVVLKGSIIDTNFSTSWQDSWPKSLAEREQIFRDYGKLRGDVVELTEDIVFSSPNQAGGFAAGRNVNAWTTWKDGEGRTMDEVVRKSTK